MANICCFRMRVKGINRIFPSLHQLLPKMEKSGWEEGQKRILIFFRIARRKSRDVVSGVFSPPSSTIRFPCADKKKPGRDIGAILIYPRDLFLF